MALFIVVGGASAAVHLGVVVALVEALTLPPLWANLGGWAVAFWVSFAGHRWLTFGHQQAPLWPSMARFGLLSFGGFALNEAAYALALQWWPHAYHVVLAVVLVGVAGVTYVLSRWWAFASARPAPDPASGAPRTRDGS